MAEVNYKLVFELVRRLIGANKKDTITTQFLGKSIQSDWERPELIFSVLVPDSQPLETIVMCSGGDSSVDVSVAEQLLDANASAKVVLVRARGEKRSIVDSRVNKSERFVAFRELRYPVETAAMVVALAESINFTQNSFVASMKRLLKWMKFNDASRPDSDGYALMATAASLPGHVEYRLSSGWRALETKSPFPVFNEVMLSSRWIIASGRFLGADITVYKQVSKEAVADEIEKIGAFSCMMEDLENKYIR